MNAKSNLLRWMVWLIGLLGAGASTRAAGAQDVASKLSRFVECTQDDGQACFRFDRPNNYLETNAKTKTGIHPKAANSLNYLDQVKAIIVSKILFSGTVLKLDVGADCQKYDWNIVTQTAQSSSVLIYGPSDIGGGNCDGSFLFLTVPVEVLWAEVSGYLYKSHDSFHKGPSEFPSKLQLCEDNRPDTELINLCDRHEGPLSWIYRTGWLYTRLTQPGTGQGSITYSPVLGNSGTLKLNYDVQTNFSSKFGPGWVILPVLFEKDANQKANLDSLITGMGYELHLGSKGNLLPKRPALSDLAMRAAVVQFKSGIELAPTRPRDLNTVQAQTLKLPVVLNIRQQPSSLTFFPVFGLEEVHHVNTHLSGESTDQFRRVLGADASLRWPFRFTHNFLGDKPVTIDYTYRSRWLSNTEPSTDFDSGGKELLSTSRQAYYKIAFLAPISSYLQFKISVQSGSLPPDFRILGHSLQVGLSFSDPGGVEH
jgi:hypothetical protein